MCPWLSDYPLKATMKVIAKNSSDCAVSILFYFKTTEKCFQTLRLYTKMFQLMNFGSCWKSWKIIIIITPGSLTLRCQWHCYTATLDSAVSKTPGSLTLRCQWHCYAWLWSVKNTRELDFAVSMTSHSFLHTGISP